MPEIQIRNEHGQILNARVELNGSDLILHSRSGAGTSARNPDYRAALMTILSRLAAGGRKPDVFLDSRGVQHLPIEQRLIASAAELSGNEVDQFNYLIRAMNKDRPSRGAWSRILLHILGDAASISTLVTASGSSPGSQTSPEAYSPKEGLSRTNSSDAPDECHSGFAPLANELRE